MPSNDFDDEFPRAGGRNTVWFNSINNWQAPNRFLAYNITPDGKGGKATITSSLYLLVKYTDVSPRSFVCKSDSGVTEFDPYNEGVYNQLFTLWDFGNKPWEHCSYSYHMPYGLFRLTTSSDPNLAVVADRNPWIPSPTGDVKQFPGRYKPGGRKKSVNAGNSLSHQSDGQNVLFLDIHVGFEESPTCGIQDDNIYTWHDGTDIQLGGKPVPYVSQAQARTDSLLVNDGQ